MHVHHDIACALDRVSLSVLPRVRNLALEGNGFGGQVTIHRARKLIGNPQLDVGGIYIYMYI